MDQIRETTDVANTEEGRVDALELEKQHTPEAEPKPGPGQDAPAEESKPELDQDAPEAESKPELDQDVSEVESKPELEQDVSEVESKPELEQDVSEVEPERDLDLVSPEVEAQPGLEQEDAGQMGELAVEDWDYQRPKRGQVRVGVILTIDDQEIVIDVGDKRDGIVPYADMQRMGPEALAELSVGDEVPVYILRPEDRDGNLLVSLFLARQEQAWLRAQTLADSGEAWEGVVDGYNKGGLVVPFDDIRGFVPASQVPGFPRGLGQEERIQRLAELVGDSLMVKVIEVNRRKRRLILSASAAQRQWRQQHRKRLLEELREGEVRSGHVSSLCSFGAFVDLGGTDGLIHLSELSWRRVRHPREVVSVGEKVEVYVLRLDKERKRIGLSLKRLQPEPWALIEEKYELGQLIEGTVTNVVDFGAFAEIEEGIEGLIHVSELTDGPISHPREVVKKGDLLLLRIIRIDARRKRLGLSLKRVLEAEWAEWAAGLAVPEDETEPKAEDVALPADIEVQEAETPVEQASDVPEPIVVEPALEVEEESAGPFEDTAEDPEVDVADSMVADADEAGEPAEPPSGPESEVADTVQEPTDHVEEAEESELQDVDQSQAGPAAVEAASELNGSPDTLAVEDPDPAIVES
jgi:small subunit ribosomal protein S1